MKKNHYFSIGTGLVFFLLTGMLAGLYSCQEVRFDTGSDVKISFSSDTLSFDTVFTEVGSTTRYFKIYNKSKHYARIDRVELREPSGKFRINTDGYSGPVIEDLEIPPNDSVYVFVEVTVDPDDPLSVSPFVIEDAVEFRYGDRSSSVILNAWGQNANYIPQVNGVRKQVLYSCDMQTWKWDDPKPYVIYGVVFVDSCTLELPPGTRVYVHGGTVYQRDGAYNDGVLYIGKNASLKIRGTQENPVTFQSDRLEKDYQDRVAQWGRIQLASESKGNEISHARLRHANIGLLVDSMAEVSIDHSVIGFNGGASLAGFRGIVRAQNSVFHTAAGYNLRVDLGGSYQFDYCTFANVGFGQEAVGVTNYFCYEEEGGQCVDPRVTLLDLRVRNSILYSSSADALTMVNGWKNLDYFQIDFQNSLIRMDQLLNSKRFPDFLEDFPSVVRYRTGEPLFKNSGEYDFMLDTTSVARGIGLPIPGIPDDLDGRPRDPAEPDAGAYEF